MTPQCEYALGMYSRAKSLHEPDVGLHSSSVSCQTAKDLERGAQANVEKKGPVIPLVDDVIVEDFVIEGLGFLVG